MALSRYRGGYQKRKGGERDRKMQVVKEGMTGRSNRREREVGSAIADTSDRGEVYGENERGLREDSGWLLPVAT